MEISKALRTHILRLLGPKTILYEAFGAILSLWGLRFGGLWDSGVYRV